MDETVLLHVFYSHNINPAPFNSKQNLVSISDLQNSFCILPNPLILSSHIGFVQCSRQLDKHIPTSSSDWCPNNQSSRSLRASGHARLLLQNAEHGLFLFSIWSTFVNPTPPISPKEQEHHSVEHVTCTLPDVNERRQSFSSKNFGADWKWFIAHRRDRS